jgi:cellobiose-specific phosphotransferase system component IIA
MTAETPNYLCITSSQTMRRAKPIPDIQKQLMQHVKLCERAKKLARIGLDHVKSGEMDKAQRAHDRAQAVFDQAKKLEHPMIKPKRKRVTRL